MLDINIYLSVLKRGRSYASVYVWPIKSLRARRTPVYFHSPRTHWLRCPMDMIDRTAEGLHCGELGQGVAVLSCLLSSFFHHYHFQAFLIVVYHIDVLNVPNFLSFSCFFSTLCSSDLSSCSVITHILRSFCFTWSYLNVSPQLTPSLLSTELQYSLLMQITLNPPIAAVSRKSQAAWQKNARAGRYQKNMCMQMVACICNSCSCLWDLMLK